MLEQFTDHLRLQFPELFGTKNLLAISGGMDSVVLADLLKINQIDFSFAHCNFQLRGDESEKDETFVKELAKKYSLTCFTQKFDQGSACG